MAQGIVDRCFNRYDVFKTLAKGGIQEGGFISTPYLDANVALDKDCSVSHSLSLLID
ncbi:MAG TPA: hypothetical protein VI033_06580 [Candidatus Nitrosopolaris sp.]